MSTYKNKISILFVIGNFGIGGKERQLTELINNVSQEKYAIHLLLKNDNGCHLDKIRKHLNTICNFNRSHFQIKDFFRIAAHIQKIKPDVICTWAEIPSYYILLASFFIPHHYRLINFSVRSAPNKLTPRLKIKKAGLFLFRYVVANSQAGLKAYGQERRKRRYVLYNGFNQERIPSVSREKAREIVGFPHDKFIVVMVASLTEKKDHATFLKAIAECKRQKNNFQFYIVGDGFKYNILKEMAEKTQINGNLSFLGKRDDVEFIFKAADISVLTSTQWYGEGISNSILESMSCGTPVIATDSPGSREIIQDGMNGVIIPCGDSLRLAEEIVQLYRSQEIRELISDNAQKTIEEKFSIEQMIGTFEDIIQKC